MSELKKGQHTRVQRVCSVARHAPIRGSTKAPILQYKTEEYSKLSKHQGSSLQAQTTLSSLSLPSANHDSCIMLHNHGATMGKLRSSKLNPSKGKTMRLAL